MEKQECKQDKCTQEAAYRYTWPGRDESYICDKCSAKLLAIATAMGFYVQLIPLGVKEVSE